jgi:zinc protease
MPVIVEEHRGSDVVALQLWVRAGGRDETSTELGLAHYLEHMLFRGTPSRPPGFIDREVERVGGRINAGTSLDYTYYHTVLPANRAAAGIEMLADVSMNASLDASVLEQEKRVVLEEMRRGQDSPGRVLSERLYAMAFDGHPYGRPVIGREPLIRGLTRETLLSFYRRHYAADAFALVVVGAIDPAEAIGVATRSFGALPRAGVRRLPLPAPRELTPGRDDVVRPGSQAQLGMGWLGPRIDHADTAAVDLLMSILGQSRSSRLTRSLRERLGLVSTIGSGYSALEVAGMVTITARLDPGNLGRAEQEIVSEIQRVREQGVTEAERRRAVTRAEAHEEFSAETAEGRAFALGRAETIWRLDGELAYVDRLRSVGLDQIRMVARRYLDPGRYVRAAVLPEAR